jgi:hypothetical protein
VPILPERTPENPTPPDHRTSSRRTRLVRWGAVVLATFAAWPGCARPIEVERGPQAYYQTAFPRYDSSTELERILESVGRISVTTIYENYVFPEDAAPLETEPITPTVLAQAVDTVTVDRSRAATAVLLTRRSRNLLLLTADHAVQFPDTIVQFFGRRTVPELGDPPVRRIRSIAILRQRSNWLVGFPELAPFEVLARDELNDLAFLGSRIPTDTPPETVRELPVEMGNAGRLSWGSFVYVVGYPAGYPMVTRGIVSDPRAEISRSFVVDGLWNEGMSGGLILGVRGNDETLEWVGMARAAAAQTERRLAPPEGAHEDLDPLEPYLGPIFLEEVRRIQYGITLSVPVSVIREFGSRHRSELEARGFRVPRF